MIDVGLLKHLIAEIVGGLLRKEEPDKKLNYKRGVTMFKRFGMAISAVLMLLTGLFCSAPKSSSETVVVEKIKAGALVVDVRTPEEYSTGHYPNALNIPVDEVETRLAEFGEDKGKEIVVYCKSGRRSGKAKGILEAQGFKNVTNAGGFKDMPAADQK